MHSRTGIKMLFLAVALSGGILLSNYFQRKYKRKKLHSFIMKFYQEHTVCLVSTPDEWEHCRAHIMKSWDCLKVLGLDCEWVSDRPVASLQLGTLCGYCVIVRLCRMSADNIPQSLRELLADKSVVKVGVGVNDDAKRLTCDYNLVVRGCVDLRHVQQRICHVYQCKKVSLAELAKHVLGVTLSKDDLIRCGNWEADGLSSDQLNYAAMDALVAARIYQLFLIAKLTGVDLLRNPEAVSTVTSEKLIRTHRCLCQGVIDVARCRQSPSATNAHQERLFIHASKKKCSSAYKMRQRPLWDNCELLAPDNQLLCTCDRRKAVWYIQHDLGEIVSEDPLVVRLMFEPAGRPTSRLDYYLQTKQNMCVVCGCVEGYIRKFIIPLEYRKHLPMVLKGHNSHDVLLMCIQCHRVSSEYDEVLRRQLAAECQAPFNCRDNSNIYPDRQLQQVNSAGKALLRSRKEIPAERVRHLEKILSGHYGNEKITDHLLVKAAMLNTMKTRTEFVVHGKRVVDAMTRSNELLAFHVRWRKHFIHTMKPQYLPRFWSVDYVPTNWISYRSHSLVADSDVCSGRRDTDKEQSLHLTVALNKDLETL